ncbi:MAG: hypothetical protein EPO58_16075 [Chitinophagaceae bacterium]|nr:MAG: hypothetical protein EPO58_16075 [Chitinophagaceae bacterium]
MEREDLLHKIEEIGFRLQNAAFRDSVQREKGEYNYRYYCIPNNNRDLAGTDFCYEDQNEFIHFTSLDNLYHMLQSCSLRLYNLVNMDDKLELEYALHDLSFHQTDKWIKDKENIFCLSMCSYPEINDDETAEHLLWKIHGRNGAGVYVRLQVENNSRNWEQYHLSKVYYHTTNVQAIKELHETIDNIELDPKVCCFFKNSIYSFEHEIRLLFDARTEHTVTVSITKDDKQLYPILIDDKLIDKENVKYVELPLANLNTTLLSFFGIQGSRKEICLPRISITEIVLGYRYSQEEVLRIQEKIKSFIDVPVTLSRLKKYY